MNNLWIHPSLVLIAGALLLPLIPKALKKAFLLFVPLAAFGVVLSMLGQDSALHGQINFLHWTLTFGRVDKLALVFAVIMSGMACVGTLYGLHVEEDAQHSASWIYVSGSLGAIFAGDLLVLFLFWEVMAFSSVFLVWFRRTPESTRAGFRYLLVHVAGGLSLLAGIIVWLAQPGATIEFSNFVKLGVAGTPAGVLILVGIIVNAAVPPFQAWLPDAYPNGTFNGSVFLSAFTTKTAVYALCRGFAGMDVLIWLGVIMSLYGVLYAVIENDVRRLFAYHIISQVGYMVAGAGIGTELAINGACAHAFAHILYKGLLFMGGGAVLHMTGETRMSHLGGLYKKMPWTFLLTLIGGLSISAFPLFSGFVSKSMITAAAFQNPSLYWAGFFLLLASIGTFYCNGLKVPYFVWFGSDKCSDEVRDRAGDPPWNMLAAMGIAAFLCIFLGIAYGVLYRLLPFGEVAAAYHPYNAPHISESLQILCFTACAFFLMVRTHKIEPHAGINIDNDWFYRRAGVAFQWLASKPIQAIDTAIGEVYRVLGIIPLMWTTKVVDVFDRYGIDGVVDGLAERVRATGQRLRLAQSGAVQANLAITVAVAAVVIAALVYFVA
ncbi:MAG TPA: Na(+)/H(+) antiporter subunit D [Opitutaceae bacterium]|nr:Na(+)/H(+) antiporter subunit D [Opitutaceae bacterium]